MKTRDGLSSAEATSQDNLPVIHYIMMIKITIRAIIEGLTTKTQEYTNPAPSTKASIHPSVDRPIIMRNQTDTNRAKESLLNVTESTGGTLIQGRAHSLNFRQGGRVSKDW